MNLVNNYVAEKEFQSMVSNELEIQKNIIDVLELNSNKLKFEKEVEFINGITSDFIILDDKVINAIIECKRADIGITEYVRGVGQLFQYEYFQDEKITPKKFSNISYDEKINNNILLIPSDFVKNTNLNIGRLKYPKNSKILELHIFNKRVREITKEELKKLAEADEKKITTISQYYVRDVRLFEIYIAHKLLYLLNIMQKNINRIEIENKYLRHINVINNKNWRNVLISLSSLGFIGNNNKVLNTQDVNKTIEEYIELFYTDYLSSYVDVIMQILVENSNQENIVEISNQELCKQLRKRYKNKEVLFLTESKGRYISSWLNILRDDIGCIDFEPRKKIRKINFVPKELNKRERILKIKKYSKANSYVESFLENVASIISK